MTRINLLPWRELQRKEREREFFTIAGGAALLMALFIVYGHFHMTGVIEDQNGRNSYLGEEIKKVEAQITEIQSLEAEKSQLLSKMKVIEELQGQRPQMVHVFDELVTSLPEGIFISSLKQTGATITVEGIAQSNARVSAFMRNIESSEWLTEPRLNVIEALSAKDEQKGSKFILNIKQKTPGEEMAEEEKSKETKPKAANKGAKNQATKASKP